MDPPDDSEDWKCEDNTWDGFNRCDVEQEPYDPQSEPTLGTVEASGGAALDVVTVVDVSRAIVSGFTLTAQCGLPESVKDQIRGSFLLDQGGSLRKRKIVQPVNRESSLGNDDENDDSNDDGDDGSFGGSDSSWGEQQQQRWRGPLTKKATLRGGAGAHDDPLLVVQAPPKRKRDSNGGAGSAYSWDDDDLVLPSANATDLSVATDLAEEHLAVQGDLAHRQLHGAQHMHDDSFMAGMPGLQAATAHNLTSVARVAASVGGSEPHLPLVSQPVGSRVTSAALGLQEASMAQKRKQSSGAATGAAAARDVSLLADGVPLEEAGSGKRWKPVRSHHMLVPDCEDCFDGAILADGEECPECGERG
jgi:hypothetical protein